MESGQDDFEVYCSSERVWIYNCISEMWTVLITKGYIPFPSSGSTAVIIDDALYIYGGVEELTEDLWRYCCELHRLDLTNLTWTSPIPDGNSPQGSDKAVGWAYDKKIYIFGGYGQCSRCTLNGYSFEVDPSNHANKGWNNQLSIYDPSTNRWTTPKTGGVPPRPRAAHAADVSGDKVFIFGGRLAEMRANDLYVLDLKKMYWTQISIKDSSFEIPEGRSWHSFNFITENRAVLFGGLSRNQIPCGDWWECEIEGNQVTWHLKGTVPKEQTLVWHRTALSNFTKELVIVGGVTCSPYNMKEEDHVGILHVIPFTPPSLLSLSLQEIVKNGIIFHLLKKDCFLPKCLLDLLMIKFKVRYNKAVIYCEEHKSVIK
ncbi:kelch domain-containing protein 1 isoform X2 [Halyomorpha halys]|uniref:kelch domain-containing protein 1 isoform X2 n=1 Tax=Halyomorpha halys TaxID=286706 RepID=UPI0006D51A0D|nr:kelch domain-containing protein 1 isoform X2 [Halyomorpha halys]